MDDGERSKTTRRAVLTGAAGVTAWSIPAVLSVVGAPQAAASSVIACNASWLNLSNANDFTWTFGTGSDTGKLTISGSFTVGLNSPASAASLTATITATAQGRAVDLPGPPTPLTKVIPALVGSNAYSFEIPAGVRKEEAGNWLTRDVSIAISVNGSVTQVNGNQSIPSCTQTQVDAKTVTHTIQVRV